jgi:peptide-methionine (S)-S-oxide reductase
MDAPRLRWLMLVALLAAGGSLGAEEMPTDTTQTATFAAGCFWGVEKIFGELPGVRSTRVGYTGGTVADPSYEEVCTGRTGHAEAIEVAYDPSKVSYEELVEFFFTHHDSTTRNRQGNDVGTQYRSAIFYHTPEQRAVAERAIRALDASGVLRGKVTTTLEPAGPFYAAEEYHQDYLKKNPNGYCHILLQPAKTRDVLRAALSISSTPRPAP